MNENLKAFMQKASEDSALKEKVTAITGSLSDAKEELVKIAESYGYSFTVEDIDAAGTGKEQLSEDELRASAGGVVVRNQDDWKLHSTCWCSTGGGGCADEYQKHCACVIGGAGEFTALGKQMAENDEIAWCGVSGAKVPMWCLIGGAYN